MPLKKRAVEVLRAMVAAAAEERHDDAEIVCEGISCWMGAVRVHRRTVSDLIAHMCLTFDDSGGCQHFGLNSTSEAVAKDPRLADEMVDRVYAGRQFTIVDGRLVDM